jgi:phenylacetate-coenzyme A ligase PaaK-like adenylate-forming protein
MMFNPEKFKSKIFSASINFEEDALELFQFQVAHVEIYKQYISLLRINPSEIKSVNEIPFLPISFFKTHKVVVNPKPETRNSKPETVFTSSGTTGASTSKHYVADINWYEESFTKAFQHFYGNIEEHCILALLPSYLEREGSSLIYMTEQLIKKFKSS